VGIIDVQEFVCGRMGIMFDKVQVVVSRVINNFVFTRDSCKGVG
jgi:hypothetical protein